MNSKEIKSVFDNLAKYENLLNQGQISFINSLKKQFTRTKRLSDKQTFILTEIAKYKLQSGAGNPVNNK